MGEALRLYHGSKSGIEGSIKPIGSSVNDFGRGFCLCRFLSLKTGETSRAIPARFPLAGVLSVYPGFHAISNDRAVEEMIAIAERCAA